MSFAGEALKCWCTVTPAIDPPSAISPARKAERTVAPVTDPACVSDAAAPARNVPNTATYESHALGTVTIPKIDPVLTAWLTSPATKERMVTTIWKVLMSPEGRASFVFRST